jgi:hypothetical protein
MRSQFKDLTDFFGRSLGVTHGTMSTQISLPGAVNLLQIQFDAPSSASDTSFQLSRSGVVFKLGAFAAPGTREVSFAGRALSCPAGIVITRPFNDSHGLFWTLIYTQEP